jgi:DNA polymerase V
MIAPSHYGDFFLHGRRMEIILTTPTADLLTLQREAIIALEKIYQPEIPYRKAGILLAGLVEAGTETMSMFAEKDLIKEQKGKVLTDEIYRLNQRFGKDLIKLGCLDDTKALWHEKKGRLSPAYTTRWSDLKVVRC